METFILLVVVLNAFVPVPVEKPFDGSYSLSTQESSIGLKAGTFEGYGADLGRFYEAE